MGRNNTLRSTNQTRIHTSGTTTVKTGGAYLDYVVIFNNGSDHSFTIQDGDTILGDVKPSGDVPRQAKMGLDFTTSLRTVVTGSGPANHWWKFDETTGSAAEDDGVDTDVDLTLNNMENGDWIVGKVSNCLDFDGVDETATGTGQVLPDTSSEAFSISYWIKFDTLAKNSYYVVENTAGVDALYIWLATEGAMNFLLGNWRLRVVSNNIFTINTWYHIVFTYNGNNKCSGVKLFVNNVEQTLNTVWDNLSNTSFANAKSWKFGAEHDGKIDDLRVYHYELTKSDIAWLYNSGDGRSDDRVMLDMVFVYAV